MEAADTEPVYDSADEWEREHPHAQTFKPQTGKKVLKIVPKRRPNTVLPNQSVTNLHRILEKSKPVARAPPVPLVSSNNQEMPSESPMPRRRSAQSTVPTSTEPRRVMISSAPTNLARNLNWSSHLNVIGSVTLVSQGVLVSSECADLLAFQSHEQALQDKDNTEARFHCLQQRYHVLSQLRQQHDMFSSVEYAHVAIAILLRTAGYMLLCSEFALFQTESVLTRVVHELTLLCDMTDLLFKDYRAGEYTSRPEHIAAVVHNETFVQSMLLLDLAQHTKMQVSISDLRKMFESTIRMVSNPWLRYQFERTTFGLQVSESLSSVGVSVDDREATCTTTLPEESA